ncbi:MAG TPA: hypothetical protein PLL22_09195, partial [Microbacteriaceae bacterium]|nr:hypothetical protein [Microbacteriaceae bacterium]
AAAWGAALDEEDGADAATGTEGDAPGPDAARVLNQAEIDSLLCFDSKGGDGGEESGIQRIISSGLVSYERLPMLEIVFDRMVRLMSTTLRNFTSDNVEVSIDGIVSLRFADYLNSIPLPAMLGVTRGASAVGLQVIIYAWATVVCSLLLIPVAGMGIVYTAAAVAFGGWFIVESHVLYSRAVRGLEPSPMRVFHSSITYLTLLFVAIAIDPLLPF